MRSCIYDLPRVDDEQRKLAREIMQMGGARTIGAVAAIEGDGFWSAGVRSILTGICLFARPAFPWKIVDGSLEAARWLATRWSPSDNALSHERIQNILQELSAQAPDTAVAM